MRYDFPAFANIEDVLPAIKGSPEFIVVEKDGYTVINYVIAGHETFPAVMTGGDPTIQTHDDVYDQLAAVRRECRGLIFGHRGQIINRRYHKFFNVNERDETAIHQIDWSKPHHILEKLDGSMVSPCLVKGHLRWMTKMGITDTSMEAEVFVAQHPEYTKFALDMLDDGWTPIFEWCSNKNRIVLDYSEDRLVLTALRTMWMGQYATYHEMLRTGKEYGIDVVEAWESTIDYAPVTLTAMIREAEGTEGVVVRFEDGHMVKIKSDWYVRIHKVKSMLANERDVVKLILNHELDDMLPILPREDVEKIEAFQIKLIREIKKSGWTVYQTVLQNRAEMDRKEFALVYAPTFDPVLCSLIFKFWDAEELNEVLITQTVIDRILKNCESNQSYRKVKTAFLTEVNYA